MAIDKNTAAQHSSAQERLARIIGDRIDRPGDFGTPIEGLGFFRREHPSPPVVCMVEPSIILVARARSSCGSVARDIRTTRRVS